MDYLFIDGTNLLHRAYYALAAGVGGSEGADPREALALFGKMAARSIDFYRVPAPRVVACFDNGDSGRRVLYPEYKANRKQKPPALAETLALAPGFCVAQGWNVAAPEGFEADDTIAALVALAGAAGVRQVNVLSGDKDLYQLLDITNPNGDQRVFVTRPDGVEIDGIGFADRYGFAADLWPTHNALVGEPGDNIPGVPGIGTKKATALIQAYGCLEQVYMYTACDPRPRGITPRDVASLHDNRALAFTCLQLATLRTDAPVELP